MSSPWRGPLGSLRHLSVEEVGRLIAAHLAHLPQAERMVLARRNGLGTAQKPMSYTAIAREMGLSLEKVRLIEMAALRRLHRLHVQSTQSTTTPAQEGDADGPAGRAE